MIDIHSSLHPIPRGRAVVQKSGKHLIITYQAAWLEMEGSRNHTKLNCTESPLCTMVQTGLLGKRKEKGVLWVLRLPVYPWNYVTHTSLSLEIIHKTNPRRLLPKEDSTWNFVEIKPLRHYTCLGNSIVLGDIVQDFIDNEFG